MTTTYPLREVFSPAHFRAFSCLNGGGHCSSDLQVLGGWSVIVYSTTGHPEIHPLNKATRRWKSSMSTIIIIKKKKKAKLIDSDRIKTKKP